MIKSGFFNSVNGDRIYKAEEFAEYFSTFIGNGVFPNPSDGLQVTESVGMDVIVNSGQGWVNGYYIVNDTDYTLSLDVADGVLNRIDRIVMQLNYLTRAITLVIKKGSLSSEPIAPVLQRDTDVYELALADIYVSKGAVSITQSKITDTRLNSELCGIVHGTVEQVDTTTLFNQYQTWIDEKKTEYNTDLTQWTSDKKQEINTWQAQEEADFNNWFLTIQGILDENVAGNLQNQIGLLSNLTTTDKTNLVSAINEVNAEFDDDTRHKFVEDLGNVTLDFKKKFFFIDENDNVFYNPNGDGNAGSSLGENGLINLWKVM